MKIGNKIKRLRLENGLTQEEVADRCELTKGYISQLERDLTSPSISTLASILECLGINLNEFFSEDEAEKVVFREEDIFVKEDTEQNYLINWIVPNAQKNEMEPIVVELSNGGQTDIDEPHSGEEFGYVLSGSIYLFIGNDKYKVKKDECFYFKPKKPHFIKNYGKKQAKILWVSTPPSF